MKRIDLIYEKLIELYDGEGVSASDISSALGLDRANVSSDLNKLSEEGKIIKIKGKPVLFTPQEANEEESSLDKFASKNGSLFSAVEQAKAAILYPPKGMNILILGETGVGKSMFAGLIHKYAIEMESMGKDSPFITFNCADYANNPQLLIGQIFGSKKGSYTGADSDRVGLIEKANGGILFLDEVHRLTPEGQEMFFTFMDKGTFRRLGETESERSANVLIISATTENPESTLLKTFTRRIPMIIRIPSLNERSLEERFNLICEFLREESFRLDKTIMVSVNSMKALSSYNCPNNIGQLKTDVQLACAKAYADYVSRKKKEMKINTMELPVYIRQGLYSAVEHRQLWNKLIGINNRYCIFDNDSEQVLFQEEQGEVSIYDMIDLRVHELKSRGIDSEELEKEMGRDIEEYFNNYIYSVNKKRDISNLESVIDKEVINIVQQIVSYCEEGLNRTLSEKIYYGMAVHIANSIERIRKNQKIVNPQLNTVRTEHKKEFNIALNCLKIIDRVMDVSMPIDEAAFLAMFLVYDDRNVEKQDNEVKVIVVAHGASTATSMADATNKLLGANYAIGINAPIEEKPQKVINRLKTFIIQSKIESDILFLVDMGSLTTFGGELQEELGIRTKTLPLVSTLHVIEATRRAMLGYSLEEVYQETLRVNTLLEDEPVKLKDIGNKNEKLAIITVCTTGEGGAVTIKNILSENLHFDKKLVEILPIMYSNNKETKRKIKELSKEYKIICIISPFKINTEIMQFGLESVLKLEDTETIQREIDVETTYIKMGQTLEKQLKNVSGIEVLESIKNFNDTIIESLGLKISTNILIGETFHVACMIDRLKEGGAIEPFKEKEKYIKGKEDIFRTIKSTSAMLNTKYSIKISDDDICRIMSFFYEL
ncbi:sigma-54-dependent transcriptional regulator [Clostridium sp. 'White wine YQ']|uniref:sigma-54-dependent transcriptional regulator n=1 Tax=Clostridium sp. 'White wine YQ' TaxID=3027474 RepID=UPI00236643A9|nr:sigma-54-dependent transcriptional regulator [Clostridium sp. 'White wine YQ']MDD7796147.1 sigma 54-interacting transcriptional regulator [Clostridium sp. 'White wine YQ']